MYVGPWQEYKLMKVIEDLREEQGRLRQAVMDARGVGETTSASSNHNAEDESGAAIAAVTPASSSPLAEVQGQRWRPQAAPQDLLLLPPFRRVATTDASSAHVTPDEMYASEEGGGGGVMRNVGRYYPPGHPFSRGRLHDVTAQATAPPALQTSAQPSAMTTMSPSEVQPALSQPCAFTLPGHAEAEAALLVRLAQSQAAAQHPALNDLLRRPALDTAAVGQRAGQRCYERRIKLGAYSGRTGGSEDMLSEISSRGRRHNNNNNNSGTSSNKAGEDAATAELRARVERRLRLQALYSGVPVTSEEAETGTTQAASAAGGDGVQQGNNTISNSAAADDALQPTTSFVGAVGVPWDDLTRAPLCPITSTTLPSYTHTTANEAGEGAVVQRAAKVVVLAPEDDVDDVGALLNWAEQLDSGAIDTM